MPVAVIVLGLAIFAQGTSELMLAGLLPMIATDLGVTIPRSRAADLGRSPSACWSGRRSSRC